MSVSLCPLRLIAIAADVSDRLRNDPMGIDCPENGACAWWDVYNESCAVMVMARGLAMLSNAVSLAANVEPATRLR